MILYELVLKYSINWAKNHPMSPNLVTIIGLGWSSFDTIRGLSFV